MYVISEKIVKKIANQKLAYDAVAQAFIAAYLNKGKNFPVLHGNGTDVANSFGVKAGNLSELKVCGLKVGSYWANNHHRYGIPNHGSTTLLLDDETGIPQALINAGYLNGLRTAAANAVASHHLARKDASILGVIGAGHQAVFEIMVICKIRDIKEIMIYSRKEETILNAIDQLMDVNISAEIADIETVCRTADILVTVTNATAPLFNADWIKPGTHISAMGADKSGKQELPVELVKQARLFADLQTQSIINGEFEAAYNDNPDIIITAIGAVLLGDDQGRRNNDEITIFDSSGIAMQDLCVAKAVLDQAIACGLVTQIEF